MKKIFTLLLTAMIACSLLAGNDELISFGSDKTLDIVTWNIEHFPKQGDTTLTKVKEIILKMDVEVIAIQEVEDTVAFKKLVSELEGYDGCFGHFYWLASGYIYKTDEITVNSIDEVLYGDWNNLPRPPYVMDLTYNGEQYYVINNHLKCCGDGTIDTTNRKDDEFRRLNGNKAIKEYIDSVYTSDNVIVVGDMNDVLIDEKADNVFQPYLDDSLNYRYADMSIALGDTADWSYPTWPSHLDHILITNELFTTTDDAQTIKVDEYLGSWDAYDNAISDHRPVGIHIYKSEAYLKRVKGKRQR